MLQTMTEANWMVKGPMLNEYLQACREADMSKFKRDIRLNRIFEHSTVKQGSRYLDFILSTQPQLMKRMFTNDLTGNPIIYNWGNDMYYSPSTLQYIAVLVNLVKKFGSLDGLKIIEIGGGYGGQAKTIFDVYRPFIYHIVDLPEVCELQNRYVKDIAACLGVTQAPDVEYDLFISNYALSEIPDNGKFIELAGKCKHGYITCNTDMVKLLWRHDREEDITGEAGNYILSW